MNTVIKIDYKAREAARAAAAQVLRTAHPHLVSTGNALVDAAKNIRIELKRAFPSVAFRVKSERYSGGDSIRVYWIDGPQTKQVEAITGKYQAGSFDGMTDSYNYSASAWSDAFGDAKYIFANREFSDKAIAAAIRLVCAKFRVTESPSVEDYRNGRAYKFRLNSGAHPGDDNVQYAVNQALTKQVWK
jgi:hypothetical protein